MINAIWAQDEKGLIGKQNQMPWHLPNDLAYFKKMTINHTIVMGRKTFEGLGGKPLPKRQTILLSKNENYHPDGVTVFHTVEEVLAFAKKSKDPVFIAGGAMIYQAFLPFCEVLYRTVIEKSFEGDAYFPTIDWTQWNLVASKPGIVDEKNQYTHRFETYERVK
ncbi:MAG TPA: dihydrofolate reductase [Candidatus Tetragenococcus pullicola]|nr:dihydrofolate reductase [Candidatus Tetragenococcus pullicola]